ncbi:putative glycolipid-binding domain-containing protein [Kribbella hippodromi]|uniref:putative glycolipid-binding domain-containing protein n=1 Tax=Kribbella hippodromi TaxID=434347 RepID=UPI0031CEB497
MNLQPMPLTASWTHTGVRTGFEVLFTNSTGLHGCEDVDFESSAVTNTLPVHRIPFTVGSAVEVPAPATRDR